MIPFQLHRRIPLVRRPFYQRDKAIAERDALLAQLDAVRAERDALSSRLSQQATAPPAAAAPADPHKVLIMVTRAGSQIMLEPDMFGEFPFMTDDKLTVMPAEAASRLHRTPDGHLHIAIGHERYRVPANVVLTPHAGYLFPEHLVVLTGAGTHTMEPFGKAHVANYAKFMGLAPGMTFLEIGCGIGRDALQLIDILGPTGRFIGTDVTWDSIAWCRRNIAVQHPNFVFHHFDAQHELYNPLGCKTSLDFALPAAAGSVDRISAGSVFTHLFEDEIVHYMREIARVLKPDGLAYATFFLYSAETIEAARRTNVTHNNLMFEHAYADGCFVNDAGYPTGAVAFTDAAMQRMMARAGVRLVRPYLKGAWSGLHAEPDDGQEVAILTV